MRRIAGTKFITQTFPCDIWFKDQAYKMVVIFGLDVDTGIGMFLEKVVASQKKFVQGKKLLFYFLFQLYVMTGKVFGS